MSKQVTILLGGVLVLFMTINAQALPPIMARTSEVIETENEINGQGNSVFNEDCSALPEEVSVRTRRLCDAFINFGCVDNAETKRCHYIGRAYVRSWKDAEPIFPWIEVVPEIIEVPFSVSFDISNQNVLEVYCVNLSTGVSRNEEGGLCGTDETAIEVFASNDLFINLYGPDGYIGSLDSQSLENEPFPDITSADLENFLYDQLFLNFSFNPPLNPERAVRATSNGTSFCKYEAVVGPLTGGVYEIDISGSCFHP